MSDASKADASSAAMTQEEWEQLSPCGWCGKRIDWQTEGEQHYDGVCVGNEPGRAERILDDYHHGGYGRVQ